MSGLQAFPWNVIFTRMPPELRTLIEDFHTQNMNLGADGCEKVRIYLLSLAALIALNEYAAWRRHCMSKKPCKTDVKSFFYRKGNQCCQLYGL